MFTVLGASLSYYRPCDDLQDILLRALPEEPRPSFRHTLPVEAQHSAGNIVYHGPLLDNRVVVLYLRNFDNVLAILFSTFALTCCT